MVNRARSTWGNWNSTVLGIPATSGRTRQVGFRISLIRVSFYLGGFVSPDTSNSWAPKGKTGPIDGGNWNATVWENKLCLFAPYLYLSGFS